MIKYWFTFGSGQSPGIGCYVVIMAEGYLEARAEMDDRWGSRWAMQYDSAEAAGIGTWNLTEITEPNREEWEKNNDSQKRK